MIPCSNDRATKSVKNRESIGKCFLLFSSADLQKAGGWHWIKQLLSSDDAGLRWRAAELASAMTQNNEKCQEAALQTGLIAKLLGMIDSDIEDDTVRVKAMGALSCKCLILFNFL